MGRKLGGGSPLFWGKGAWSISSTVAWTEAHLHAKCHLDPSIRLATIDVGRKWGGLCPLFEEGRWVSITKSPGPRPTPIRSGILVHPAIWPQQIWAENWGLCPFERVGAGSLSNTMWPGSRSTCMPGFVLIRPTVRSQYTNVTERQTDRTTVR